MSPLVVSCASPVKCLVGGLDFGCLNFGRVLENKSIPVKNGWQPLMLLLVLLKLCRDQMRSDREECGIHTAPTSTFHQQPHHGGVCLWLHAVRCIPT